MMRRAGRPVKGKWKGGLGRSDPEETAQAPAMSQSVCALSPSSTPNPTTDADIDLPVALGRFPPGGWPLRALSDVVHYPKLNGTFQLVGAPTTYGIGPRYSF